MPLPITGGPLLLPEPELDPDPELLEPGVLPPELLPDTEPELLLVLPLVEWDPLPPPASELLRAPPLTDPLLEPPFDPLPDPAADPLPFALLPLEVIPPAAFGDVLVPPVLPGGKLH